MILNMLMQPGMVANYGLAIGAVGAGVAVSDYVKPMHENGAFLDVMNPQLWGATWAILCVTSVASIGALQYGLRIQPDNLMSLAGGFGVGYGVYSFAQPMLKDLIYNMKTTDK